MPLCIVKNDAGVWLHNDTVLRLRVDDNPEPIKELRRLARRRRGNDRFLAHPAIPRGTIRNYGTTARALRFISASISAISRGAVLIRSRPVSVMT